MDDEQSRPFLAQQAQTDLPEAPEGGAYDDEQQLQVTADETAAPRVESPDAVMVMTSSGKWRNLAADGGDSDNNTDA